MINSKTIIVKAIFETQLDKRGEILRGIIYSLCVFKVLFVYAGYTPSIEVISAVESGAISRGFVLFIFNVIIVNYLAVILFNYFRFCEKVTEEYRSNYYMTDAPAGDHSGFLDQEKNYHEYPPEIKIFGQSNYLLNKRPKVMIILMIMYCFILPFIAGLVSLFVN